MNTKILKEMAQEILTQDNRCTAEPMYKVISSHVRPGETEQVFFTNKAAEDFIHENGHNLEAPYIYVASGYNNKEWIAIREFLKGIAE